MKIDRSMTLVASFSFRIEGPRNVIASQTRTRTFEIESGNDCSEKLTTQLQKLRRHHSVSGPSPTRPLDDTYAAKRKSFYSPTIDVWPIAKAQSNSCMTRSSSRKLERRTENSICKTTTVDLNSLPCLTAAPSQRIHSTPIKSAT